MHGKPHLAWWRATDARSTISDPMSILPIMLLQFWGYIGNVFLCGVINESINSHFESGGTNNHKSNRVPSHTGDLFMTPNY
jgi:hypothetical protein